MSSLSGPGPTSSYNQSSVTLNSTSCEMADQSAHIFFMVIYMLTFIVGLILNGFTLRVYFCGRQRQLSSCITIYLKNLAAADFLISLCLPIRILNYASNAVPIRQIYCNFGASAFYLNMYASIMFMGYIAANRYLKIVHPVETHFLQTVRAAHIISVATWGLLLAMTGTYVLISVLTQEPMDSVPVRVSCDVLHSKQLSVFYKIIHSCSAAIFLCVLVSLIFFYYSTSRRLSLAQQRQPTSSHSKKLAKSRRNMLVLVSVFCVCFVPYHLVRVPYAFHKDKDCLFNRCLFYLKEITIMVSVLNVCLDPLIYFIFCKAFQAQLGLRRTFSTTQTQTQVERRSSGGRMSSVRRTTLTPATKHISVL
ncbi:P2Y purinoceptor 14-like [Melanotaenia boesemani]|uniref:P2Y purinoceptor 14-like n=1 Tax=Melanotaenia boesemani TaxID=1250792 RepID=UPI001C0506E6|nr:P2Y purinoceptor 14-like [Melanotaenia boesemani]